MTDFTAQPMSVDGIKRELVNYSCQNIELRFFFATDSTNTRAREYAKEAAGAALFVAERQSAGRGRLGRSFVSEGGVGLYMSLLLPLSELCADTATLTAYAAVMCAEAIEELTGEPMGIKWVNDIYHGGRKLAGILTEGIISPDTGRISYAVIGIGINVCKRKFPVELADIATDIESECGKRISREELAALITAKITGSLSLLGTHGLIERYKARSILIGERVTVHSSVEPYTARVLDIAEDASLVVRSDETGELCRLSTGEVSVRKV